MRYVFFILVSIVCLTAQGAFAETITLKNGTQIQGEIVERASYYIVVNQDGRHRRYYLDQIAIIEDDIVDPELTENIDMNQFVGTEATKIEWILKLMEANGTRDVIKKNIEEIVNNAPLDQQKELRKIFNIDGLMEKLIPIFDSHYTEQEIIELIQFYQSPIGEKMLQESPAIMDEVMKATVEYFTEQIKK